MRRKQAAYKESVLRVNEIVAAKRQKNALYPFGNFVQRYINMNKRLEMVNGEEHKHKPFGYPLQKGDNILNVAQRGFLVRGLCFTEIINKYIEENGIVNPLTMVPFKANEYQMNLLLGGFRNELKIRNYITDPLIPEENKKKKEHFSKRWARLETAAVLRKKERNCNQLS